MLKEKKTLDYILYDKYVITLLITNTFVVRNRLMWLWSLKNPRPAVGKLEAQEVNAYVYQHISAHDSASPDWCILLSMLKPRQWEIPIKVYHVFFPENHLESLKLQDHKKLVYRSICNSFKHVHTHQRPWDWDVSKTIRWLYSIKGIRKFRSYP